MKNNQNLSNVILMQLEKIKDYCNYKNSKIHFSNPDVINKFIDNFKKLIKSLPNDSVTDFYSNIIQNRLVFTANYKIEIYGYITISIEINGNIISKNCSYIQYENPKISLTMESHRSNKDSKLEKFTCLNTIILDENKNNIEVIMTCIMNIIKPIISSYFISDKHLILDKNHDSILRGDKNGE